MDALVANRHRTSTLGESGNRVPPREKGNLMFFPAAIFSGFLPARGLGLIAVWAVCGS